MKPRERVHAVIQGQKPDRLPYCFWYHFRTEPWFPTELYPEYRAPTAPEVLERYVEGMVEAEYAFWQRYQPDILKVMHDIPYEMPESLPVIESPKDWARLPRLEGDKGHFGAQLKVLYQLRKRVPKRVPIVGTLFNALYYANKISNNQLLSHYAQNPKAVKKGLDILQDNLLEYASWILDACDGIYYAVNGITPEVMPRDQYLMEFYAYDFAMVEALCLASYDSPIIMLHLHGYQEIYAEFFRGTSAHLISWSDRNTSLSLSRGSKLFGKAVMGGLDEIKLAQMTREAVLQQAQSALEQMGGTPFILAPGCSVPTDIDPTLLDAIREFAKGTSL